MTVQYNGQPVEVPLRLVCANVRKELRRVSQLHTDEYAAIEKANEPLSSKILAYNDAVAVAQLRARISMVQAIDTQNSRITPKTISEAVNLLLQGYSAEQITKAQAVDYEPDTELINWQPTADERDRMLEISRLKTEASERFILRSARAVIATYKIEDAQLKAAIESTVITDEAAMDFGYTDVNTEFWQEQDISETGWVAVIKTFR